MHWKAARLIVSHRASSLPVPTFVDNNRSDIFPTHFIAVHQSAIRALAWIRVPPTDGSGAPNSSEDPTIIASGGYDGVECLTDIREPHGNVVNRTRGTFTFRFSNMHV